MGLGSLEGFGVPERIRGLLGQGLGWVWGPWVDLGVHGRVLGSLGGLGDSWGRDGDWVGGLEGFLGSLRGFWGFYEGFGIPRAGAGMGLGSLKGLGVHGRVLGFL